MIDQRFISSNGGDTLYSLEIFLDILQGLVTDKRAGVFALDLLPLSDSLQIYSLRRPASPESRVEGVPTTSMLYSHCISHSERLVLSEQATQGRSGLFFLQAWLFP